MLRLSAAQHSELEERISEVLTELPVSTGEMLLVLLAVTAKVLQGHVGSATTYTRMLLDEVEVASGRMHTPL